MKSQDGITPDRSLRRRETEGRRETTEERRETGGRRETE